jgi:hypothetical protein
MLDIPSIHHQDPAIPPILANLDLNRAVDAGDPLDYIEVTHANAIVTALKGHRGELPSRFGNTYYYMFVDSGNHLVTPHIINMASSRAVAVQTAYKFYISTGIINFSLHSLNL